MTGLALLVLLGTIVGCGGDIGQSPEEANTLERTVEETIVVLEQPAEEANFDLERTVEESIVVLEQPAEEANFDLEQPAEEANTFSIQGYVTVDAYRYDAATGTYIHFYHDESSNLITNGGFDWIEDQLGDSPGGDPAKWISLSTDATSPVATWTQIIGEITTDGLARDVGTYASTGTGNWTITKTFAASATHTNVQLTGLQWVVTPGSDGNLLAANTFTAVTLNNGDSLTVTWTLTLGQT